MDDLENPSQEYLKRYNQGYLIAQEMPELAEQLSKIENTSPELSAFKQGIQQSKIEKEEKKYPDFLKSNRLSSLDQASEKEKEKDDFEKE